MNPPFALLPTWTDISLAYSYHHLSHPPFTKKNSGRNICHGSDGPEGAAAEIAAWFPEGVSAWESHSKAWIYE